MWIRLAHFIIRQRILMLCFLAVCTLLMAYQSKKVTMSYDFAKIVPKHDTDARYFEKFKNIFGDEDNLLVIGLNSPKLYTVKNFECFHYLSDQLTKLHGIESVISLPSLQQLEKNTEKKCFHLAPCFKEIPTTQTALDSVLQQVKQLPIYHQRIINQHTSATLMVLAINKNVLNSSARKLLFNDIQQTCNAFTEATGISLHYGGIPFVRTTLSGKIKKELQYFIALSILVTAISLLLFFRSWQVMFFALLIIAIMIIWSLGTMALLGYKITLLTALIPPILVVISVPNSVYLINKYHYEYFIHGNKIKALSSIIYKIGLATLVTNATTAIGFLVLTFTNIAILKEFGLITGLNILAAFLICIIIIPAGFSLLPAPNTKHLQTNFFKKIVSKLDAIVHQHPKKIFTIVGGCILVAALGISQLKALSYMVDDIPPQSQLKKDLHFFEQHFGGIMPLEIVISAKKKKMHNLKILQKINQLEEFLALQPDLAPPISLVALLKTARQAYYNNTTYYSLPTRFDYPFITRYLQNLSTQTPHYLNTLMDSTKQHMRIALKVADIGSHKLHLLIENKIKPYANAIFSNTNLDFNITGSTLLFVKGNTYLISNLIQSLLLAILLIAIIMALLFRKKSIIFISILPNLIPLFITAGIMGYVGIPMKPSTALIFSIAFGISVDDSIHFLTKYRVALRENNFSVSKAISQSLKETGISMIYTSIILFTGFIIFTQSEFQGTVALGLLTSITLLFAMITNLILLPALLIQFDNSKNRPEAKGKIKLN